MTDIEDYAMFCFQCEQTAKNSGCTVKGVCQKDSVVAALQDHLMHGVAAMGVVANELLAQGKKVSREVDMFCAMAIFSTLTNVNFQPADFVELIARAAALRDSLVAELPASSVSKLPAIHSWKPAKTQAELVAQAKEYQIPKRFAKLGKDRVCLQELIIYGMKGAGAYIYHASVLGEDPSEVVKGFYKMFRFLEEPDPSVDALLGACLEVGAINLLAMELLDHANTSHYGHPQPTPVPWLKVPEGNAAITAGVRAGKAILVSGHDLLELENLLKQIEAAGESDNITVYTHGEMLPTHGYPQLHKYKSLAGHYGTAWQNQKREFDLFPGPIVMTTNCYIPAPSSYVNRVFSCEPVGGLEVKRVNKSDYSAVISAAKACKGFEVAAEGLSTLTVGFARNTVMSVAGTVIDAVKAGALRRIFLIGGCDGFEKERNYFTYVAEKVPADCLMLTLACGKFKINGRDYGTLGGLPRLLDMGQCNDSYSAIQVAVALAKAFGLDDVNKLPLSLVISWFEQKAVAILLTLLHLGIKNIYVGPRIPAFFTPTILHVLQDKFQLHAAGDPDKDLAAMLAQK